MNNNNNNNNNNAVPVDSVVKLQYNEVKFKSIIASQKSVVFEAVAGAGKSYQFIEFLKELPLSSKVLVLIFNKDNVTKFSKEVTESKKIKCEVEVQTLHSFGLGLLGPHEFQKKKFDPFLTIAGKCKNRYDVATAVLNLVAKVKNVIVNKEDLNSTRLRELYYRFGIGERVPADQEEFVFAAAITFLNSQLDVFRLAQQFGNPLSIEYDDMLWLPVILNYPAKKAYNWILTDETQDLSAVQIELLRREYEFSKSENCKLFVVGDSHQSIYSFRGVANAIPQMKNLIPERFEITMNTTRRCPEKHVALAQVFVPEITAMKDHKNHPGFIIWETDILKVTNEDLVLCRNMRHLVSSVRNLVLNGRPAIVLGGKKFVAALKAFINEQKSLPYNPENLIKVANEQQQKEILNARAHCDYSSLVHIDDFWTTLKDLLSSYNSFKEITDFVAQVFSKKEKAITFSTIHRSKGETKDSVWILVAKRKQELRLEQLPEEEKNLWYVALTRATKSLTFCEFDDNAGGEGEAGKEDVADGAGGGKGKGEKKGKGKGKEREKEEKCTALYMPSELKAKLSLLM